MQQNASCSCAYRSSRYDGTVEHCLVGSNGQKHNDGLRMLRHVLLTKAVDYCSQRAANYIIQGTTVTQLIYPSRAICPHASMHTQQQYRESMQPNKLYGVELFAKAAQHAATTNVIEVQVTSPLKQRRLSRSQYAPRNDSGINAMAATYCNGSCLAAKGTPCQIKASGNFCYKSI